MPQKLNEFPKVKREGRTPMHPYKEWLELAKQDENGIELIRGKDFDAEVRTMRHNLYRVAKGLNYETVTIKDDDGEEVGIAFRILKAPKTRKTTAKKK